MIHYFLMRIIYYQNELFIFTDKLISKSESSLFLYLYYIIFYMLQNRYMCTTMRKTYSRITVTRAIVYLFLSFKFVLHTYRKWEAFFSPCAPLRFSLPILALLQAHKFSPQTNKAAFPSHSAHPSSRPLLIFVPLTPLPVRSQTGFSTAAKSTNYVSHDKDQRETKAHIFNFLLTIDKYALKVALKPLV